MGKISNLELHRKYIHPKLLAVFDKLDAGTLPGVKWDIINRDLAMADGSVWRIVESFRSYDEQRKINDEEAAGGADVTDAAPGDSLHQWGLAVDLVFRKPGWGSARVDGVEKSFSNPKTYEELGLVAAMQAQGIGWLGRYRLVDVGHWQLDISHPTEEEKSGMAWWQNTEGVKMTTTKSKWIMWALLAVGAAAIVYKVFKPKTRYQLAKV